MRTKHTLFRSSAAESKADATTKIARGIVEAETAARQANMARLRAARDASGAAQKVPGQKKKPRRKGRLKNWHLTLIYFGVIAAIVWALEDDDEDDASPVEP